MGATELGEVRENGQKSMLPHLVNLNQVHVAEPEPGLGERGGDRRHRSDAHHLGVYACHRVPGKDGGGKGAERRSARMCECERGAVDKVPPTPPRGGCY